MLQISALMLLWSPLKRAWCRRCPIRASIKKTEMRKSGRTEHLMQKKVGQVALYLQFKKERARLIQMKAFAAYLVIKKQPAKSG